ncbi:MAG: ATP-binding cassette domain-containing protein, partial [Woeseiaceae bacterium]|nr:ATP-binding cassette domain-containing protein [Woeseiaceae bacterium]
MTSLVVDGLTVRYPGADTCVVDGVGFTVREGETVAIAGVSGSGKTQTVLAVTRLLDTAAVVTGSARFGDVDLLSAPEEDVERVRGAGIGMVFQDPAASLNPHRRVGDQLRVILEHHGHARGRQARRRVVDMLRRVQLPDPERQARAYPHELSGGMRQRVMIAAALIAEPSIVIADEPTTALDTTVQAQILELMRTLTAETGVGLVLITHDLGIIAENAERMLLLDRGRLVEAGPVERVLARPDSDAMRALLQAADAGVSLVDAGTTPVLELSDYAVSYAERRPRPFRLRRRLDAVKPMDLTLRERETVALVGESGSGKTSLARSIAGLIPPAHGRARIRSRDLAPRLRNRSIDDLRGLQMVFQDPAGSFDPARR